jgi:hypothetical protein
MTVPPGWYAPPPPDGEPVYVPEPYPYQPQYQQSYPMAYVPRYGSPPARRTEPPIGWILFAVGVLTAVASLLPWAVLFGVSVNGTGGDGTLTVLCAVIISSTGLIIGLGQGLLWAPIAACGCAVLVSLTALADIGNIGRFVDTSGGNFDAGAITVGPGLWLTLIAGILGIAVSVVAMVRRRPVAT